jgi:hypothetical protein
MRLRSILFWALILVSVVPVIILAAWVQRAAVDREMDAANDKHLLLAHNLTLELSQYIRDAERVFRHFVLSAHENYAIQDHAPKLRGTVTNRETLLIDLKFRSVSLIDVSGRVAFKACGLECNLIAPFSDDLRGKLSIQLNNAKKNLGAIYFSNVLKGERGSPAIFFISALENDFFAIGELSTEAIIAAQQGIKFGRGGHAAVVDKVGRVLAHPNSDWTSSSRDISSISIVKKVIAGETGVEQFYSPSAQANMVAGFTVVPITGWGVMIPQPLSELVERANDIRIIAFSLTLVGIFTAALI